VARGRHTNNQHLKGIPTPVKLTWPIVQRIRERRAAGERPTDLAREYAVSPHTIKDIVKFRYWKTTPKPTP